jgi:hypothetical protein
VRATDKSEANQVIQYGSFEVSSKKWLQSSMGQSMGENSGDSICLSHAQRRYGPYWYTISPLDYNVTDFVIAEGPFLKTFLSLPGTVDLSASARFNPQRGSIEIHSFATTLNIGEIDLSVDAIRSILESLKLKTQPESEPLSFDVSLSPTLLASPKQSLSPPASPYTPSIMSPRYHGTILPTTPNSPFLEVLSVSLYNLFNFKRA